MTNHSNFYQKAKYYDIAFDFKNIAAECDFILAIFQKIHQRAPKSFLELAAGPALHSLEFARRGLKVTALDLSPEMVAYGKEKAEKNKVPLSYLCQNMLDFELSEPVDIAGIFMDSTSYLLDNQAVYQHFEAVAKNLIPTGLYLLEMGHPRDIFKTGKSTSNQWEMEQEDIKVKMQWGSPDDLMDPTTQITQTTVTLEIKDGATEETLQEVAPQRCFTTNEFKALVEASKHFELKEIYGAMDLEIPFNNDKKSWRMIPILQKQ